MAHAGALPTPEDPKQRGGAQGLPRARGDSPHPCPPERQEPADLPMQQAVSARAAGCTDPAVPTLPSRLSRGWHCCPPLFFPKVYPPSALGVHEAGCGGLGVLTLSGATAGIPSFLTPFSPQIKRFLKEDSEEAELTQFLRDCPPTDSLRKVEPPEGRREPGHPLCGRVPTEEPADDRDTRPFPRPRPLDAQQLITAPPPPSPSRPRSPWGQLDPYDSSEVRWVPGVWAGWEGGTKESPQRMCLPSEPKGTPWAAWGDTAPVGRAASPVPRPLSPQDDKEYVGFATLPNQVHRKSVKKGFDFTLMVAGRGLARWPERGR